MRRLLFVILLLSLFVFCSCQNNATPDSTNTTDSEYENTEEPTTEAAAVIKPSISEIRSICKLATLECHYNNVAKSTKTAGTGLSHLGEDDREFWIEYSGVVKIGVDMSKVKITIVDNKITIFMPDAEIVSYKADSESMSETIAEPDKWNKNPISSEDKTEAMNIAEIQIKESIENNTTLLSTAKEKAKTLIENYINRLGEETDVNYEIVWKDIEEGTQ